MFAMVTLAAMGTYGLVPVAIEVECSFGNYNHLNTFLSVGDQIDIQGRNKGHGYETVAERIEILTCKRVAVGNSRRLNIEFRSNLYQKWELERYQIHRIAGLEPNGG